LTTLQKFNDKLEKWSVWQHYTNLNAQIELLITYKNKKIVFGNIAKT